MESMQDSTNPLFRDYFTRVLTLRKAMNYIKATTADGWEQMSKRIFPAIGGMRLQDITTYVLNDFFLSLTLERQAPMMILRAEIGDLLQQQNLNIQQMADLAGISRSSVKHVVQHGCVTVVTARRVADAVDMAVADLFEEQEGSPLSPSYIKRYHAAISAVFDQAVKEGLVPSNPARGAMTPKVTRKQATFLHPAEVRTIIAALENEPVKWQAAVLVLALTGARRGEVLGLTWDKVDFQKKQILIDRGLVYTVKQGTWLDTPKTGSSVRYVALPEQVLKVLAVHKTEQDRAAEMWNGQRKDEIQQGKIQPFNCQNLVFTGLRGQPLQPSGFNAWLTSFLSRNGFSHIGPHAFRHSVASLLIYKGVDVVSISRSLGHADPATTTSIYGHMLKDAEKRNAILVAEAFLGPEPLL